MKSHGFLASFFDRLLRLVGLMTILNFVIEQWPMFYHFAAWLFLSIIGIWCFWKFFLLPFREGLDGR